jgi:hypothetical protein
MPAATAKEFRELESAADKYNAAPRAAPTVSLPACKRFPCSALQQPDA